MKKEAITLVIDDSINVNIVLEGKLKSHFLDVQAPNSKLDFLINNLHANDYVDGNYRAIKNVYAHKYKPFCSVPAPLIETSLAV